MSPLVSLDSRGSLRFSAPTPAPAQLPSLLSLPSLPDLTSVLRLGGSPAQLHRPTNRPTAHPPAGTRLPIGPKDATKKLFSAGHCPIVHTCIRAGVPSPSHTLLVFTESTLLVHVKNEDPA